MAIAFVVGGTSHGARTRQPRRWALLVRGWQVLRRMSRPPEPALTARYLTRRASYLVVVVLRLLLESGVGPTEVVQLAGLDPAGFQEGVEVGLLDADTRAGR